MDKKINFEIINNYRYKLNDEEFSFDYLDDYRYAFDVCHEHLLEIIQVIEDGEVVEKLHLEILVLMEFSKFEMISENLLQGKWYNQLSETLKLCVNDINLISEVISLQEVCSELYKYTSRWNKNYVEREYKRGEIYKDIRSLISYLNLKDEKINDLSVENLAVTELYNIVKKDLDRFENSQKNKPAVDLYKDVKTDFETLEQRYRKYFIISIIVTLLIAIGYNPLIGVWANVISLSCSFTNNYFLACLGIQNPIIYPVNSDTLKFIFFKIGVLAVGITFTTYFLRLSSFYQLKQEQAKQTKLELEAFPDYVSGMDPSIANNLRQELALKYFGKEIDKTIIDKNGDLIQEQLKAGTELIKASTDVIKTVKPTAAKEEDAKK